MKIITMVLSLLSLGFWFSSAFAFDCNTAARSFGFAGKDSTQLSSDMPPADLLVGEDCPEKSGKCTVSRQVEPGKYVGVAARQDGYVCVNYYDDKEQESNGMPLKRAGWVRSDQLAIKCKSPKISGEAELELARIAGKTSELELFSGDSCPRIEGKCKSAGLVKPPRTIFVGERMNGYVCVQFTTENSLHSGWVKSEKLALLRFPPVHVKNWSGVYISDSGGRIDIANTGNGKLKVSGGLRTSAGHGPGMEFVGYEQIDMTTVGLNLETLTVGPIRAVELNYTQKKNDVHWSKEVEAREPRLNCSLILRRLGELLVVKDKPECLDKEGYGTGFEGVWVRDKSLTPTPVENFIEKATSRRTMPHGG